MKIVIIFIQKLIIGQFAIVLMERQEFLSSIIREIQYSLSKGYLTQIQVQILNFRLFYKIRKHIEN